MKISQAGIDLIKKFEGCVLKAYWDYKGYSIGYGHLGVPEGTVITKEQAEQLLISDLPSYESKVSEYDSVYHWTQNEFDALVSYCYNIGSIKGLVNDGKRSRKEIIADWPNHDKAGGKHLDSLKKRRLKELQIFRDGYPSEGGTKMVIIGSARIDENGHASGGKAGDQTGKEVCIQEYYPHKLGWRTIRAKDPADREAIAQDMEWACANDLIGYDQNQNQTLYNVAQYVGFNCSLVATPCETDCARLVRVCVLYAGIRVEDFYTVTEVDKLLATGAFEEVFVPLPSGLLRGDILVTPVKGHTVVALTNGDGTTGKEIDTTSNTDTNTEPAAGKYKIGWHKDGNGWWFADTENTYLKKTWKVIDHHWYYFDEEGYVLTGWQTIDGKRYYLQEGNEDHLEGACWRSDGSGAQSVWYVE